MEDRTYDEIMQDLEEQAEYELAVQVARIDNDAGGETSLALVTLDGVTRGVVTREGVLPTLQAAAESATLGEDANAVRLLRAAIQEVGIDRAIALAERQR